MPPRTSVEMTLGFDVAKQLETLQITDPVLQGFIDSGKLPVYPVREHRIQVEIQGVPLLGFMDMYHPENNDFRDQKTGRVPWNQARVDSHSQLPFYSLLIEAKHGKAADKGYIDWMEALLVDEVDPIMIHGKRYEVAEKFPKLTGRIESFERRISDLDRYRELEDIVTAAHEISADFLQFKKNV